MAKFANCALRSSEESGIGGWDVNAGQLASAMLDDWFLEVATVGRDRGRRCPAGGDGSTAPGALVDHDGLQVLA